MKNNRPDIVVKDNKRKSYLLSDISEPIDNNILVNEYNKIIKYKHLDILIEEIWHVKTTTLPVSWEPWVLARKGQINTLTSFLAVPVYINYE